ncbi:hypothetical protein ACFQ1S_39755, partial [Kibdelosporangium lantanae]
MTTGIRVGVIEDHPLYRDAVERLLREANGIELDTVAGSVAQFAARKRDDSSGVVLLDMRLLSQLVGFLLMD